MVGQGVQSCLPIQGVVARTLSGAVCAGSATCCLVVLLTGAILDFSCALPRVPGNSYLGCVPPPLGHVSSHFRACNIHCAAVLEELGPDTSLLLHVQGTPN